LIPKTSTKPLLTLVLMPASDADLIKFASIYNPNLIWKVDELVWRDDSNFSL